MWWLTRRIPGRRENSGRSQVSTGLADSLITYGLLAGLDPLIDVHFRQGEIQAVVI